LGHLPPGESEIGRRGRMLCDPQEAVSQFFWAFWFKEKPDPTELKDLWNSPRTCCHYWNAA